MDCLNLYEENIESFPAVSTSYHNEVIVWWCILFIILKLIFFFLLSWGLMNSFSQAKLVVVTLDIQSN